MKGLFFALVCVIAAASAYPSTKEVIEKDATTCLLCKTLVLQLENTILDPNNEQAVADQLGKACDAIFPNNIDNANNCKNTINAFLPQILEAIINNFGDPTAICTALTMCP